MAAPSPSAIRSALPGPASSSRCCMRCRSATPRRVWRPCASAAAWASPLPSNADNQKREETKMSRVAVVTGGTRGIGKAISVALKKAGYTVVANYGGNDEAAKAFTDETGIPAIKFDVGNFAECEAAVAKITADHGPVDIIVNNAGITRDAVLHRMSPTQWNEVIQTNLASCFNTARVVIDKMR